MESRDVAPPSVWRLGFAALLAGLVVVVLQFPWGGNSADPPTCYGIFWAWTVPCGGWPALIGGAIAAFLVWLVLLVRLNPKLT
jgi:hypothetical protein